MYSAEMIGLVRAELADIDPEATTSPYDFLFNEDIVNRGIHGAIGLMSRFIPRRLVVEKTIPSAVTAEVVTVASSAAQLAYYPVKSGSLALTKAGVAKTLDTDYRINYLTGAITEIGALLPDGVDYAATYSLDSQVLYIGDIVTDFLRIDRIEYPTGSAPAVNPPFDLIGSLLYLKGETTFSANKHLRVYYTARHTPPAVDTEGSYPTHLDNAVIIGAAGMILLSYATHLLWDAEGKSTTLNAAITSMSTPLTAATTAAAAIATEIALAKGYLVSGTAYANKATAGDKVMENYGNYARIENEAASIFATEADKRLAIAKVYYDQAAMQGDLLNKLVGISDKIRGIGEYKINQFYQLLGVKAESQGTYVASNQAVE